MTKPDEQVAPEILVPKKKAIRRWVGTQELDLALGVVLFLVAVLLLPRSGYRILDSAGRRATCQTLAGLAGTMFGLTMTTISILASNIDKGIGGSPTGLPKSLVVGIIRPMFGLMRVLGALLVVSVVAIVVDTRPSAPIGALWSQPILVALAVVAAARLTRVLILLSNLLKARVNPSR